jgi:hypothetical protein
MNLLGLEEKTDLSYPNGSYYFYGWMIFYIKIFFGSSEPPAWIWLKPTLVVCIGLESCNLVCLLNSTHTRDK